MIKITNGICVLYHLHHYWWFLSLLVTTMVQLAALLMFLLSYCLCLYHSNINHIFQKYLCLKEYIDFKTFKNLKVYFNLKKSLLFSYICFILVRIFKRFCSLKSHGMRKNIATSKNSSKYAQFKMQEMKSENKAVVYTN